MASPTVSIIIPCYNSGKYLSEAIQSVENYPDKNIYEIIITNDGSTDEFTLQLLDELEKKGYQIIHQENKGPAAARNTAIKAANGEYLLFLDSDNKIRNNFIDKGIKAFKENTKVGVVYGKANFFGINTDPRFENAEFDIRKILSQNYIDMCSMVRKQVFNELGLLDENRLIIGHEDWDFWIRVGSGNWQLLFINEILFDYRVRENSLITEATHIDKAKLVRQYLYTKHLELLCDNYNYLFYQNTVYQKDKKAPLRSFFKYAYHKFKNN